MIVQQIQAHVFDPATFKTDSYIHEIDYWMRQSEPNYLVLQEHDVEVADKVAARFATYIKEKPDRIHAAPYLLNIYFEQDGNPILFWAHRVNKEEVKRYSLQETFRKLWPIICPKCDYHFKESVVLNLKYPAWVAGGERETDWATLGYTYIPREYWNRIYPEIQKTDWRLVDVALSGCMIRDNVKALIHWDCLVNHVHVSVREVEKAIIRKYVGMDKTPLTDVEKKWLKAERLPPYDGIIGE